MHSTSRSSGSIIVFLVDVFDLLRRKHVEVHRLDPFRERLSSPGAASWFAKTMRASRGVRGVLRACRMADRAARALSAQSGKRFETGKLEATSPGGRSR